MLDVPNSEFEFVALMLKFTGVALKPLPLDAETTALTGIPSLFAVIAPTL